MKKMMNWMLAAILICGASVMTSCTNDTSDNPAQEGEHRRDSPVDTGTAKNAVDILYAGR